MTEPSEHPGRWGTARPGRRNVLRGIAAVGSSVPYGKGAALPLGPTPKRTCDVSRNAWLVSQVSEVPI